jgi:hypothetical protein
MFSDMSASLQNEFSSRRSGFYKGIHENRIFQNHFAIGADQLLVQIKV